MCRIDRAKLLALADPVLDVWIDLEKTPHQIADAGAMAGRLAGIRLIRVSLKSFRASIAAIGNHKWLLDGFLTRLVVRLVAGLVIGLVAS